MGTTGSRGIVLCASAHAVMEDRLGNIACVIGLASQRLLHTELTPKQRELVLIIRRQAERLSDVKAGLHPCDTCSLCD